MLIDLHCHTKKIKKGDAQTRNVDVPTFYEKIQKANVEIVAITNHNHFDYGQYKKLKDSVQEFCMVWPGIELDIDGKQNRGHLIVIANPDNAEKFSEVVNDMINSQNPDKCLYKLREVYEKLDQCDVIYIPHFHKEPKICEEDIKELNNLLSDKTRLFKETSDYRSLGVFANYDYSVIIGSDVQNWSKYEESNFANLRLSVTSFKQFCLLAKKDKVIIDTLLNKKNSSLFRVSPHKNVNFELRIYQDINVIFGQKGTGKSEILKSMKSSYDEKGVACQSYTGSTKEDDFSKFLKTTDMVRNVSVVNADPCMKEISYLKEWEDISPTLIKNYFDWYNTKDNNRNKKRMKITDAVSLSIPDNKKLNKIKHDYDTVSDKIAKLISEIDIKSYLSDAEVSMLKKLLCKLSNKIYINLIDEWKKIQATKLVNFSLKKIKSSADKCSNTVSKPSETGFEKFVLNRIELKENLESILYNMNDKENNEYVLIGELDEKGEIYIQKKYRMLTTKSKTNEFGKGITKLKEIRKKLHNLRDQYHCDDLIKSVKEFNQLIIDEGIETIDCFLGLSKSIVANDGEEYNPSNGERGILLLQKLLKEESDVYILDEPELGMGNSYINNTILPQIVDLAKQHKTVIIATHNANIAVRTLPYMSIYRTHQNGEYNTYIGNPFNDELVNIDDISDYKNWTEESMHTLEGGKTAFYERKDIYESGS